MVIKAELKRVMLVGTTEQCHRSPEIGPHTDSHLIYDKDTIVMWWERDGLRNQRSWTNWLSPRMPMTWTPYLTPHTQFTPRSLRNNEPLRPWLEGGCSGPWGKEAFLQRSTNSTNCNVRLHFLHQKNEEASC